MARRAASGVQEIWYVPYINNKKGENYLADTIFFRTFALA
jgi:hypothetical protein